MLFFSLALAVFVSLGLISINYLRLKRRVTPQLIPNCLLTRYPVYFITGRRSLFYFMNYWNDIPFYLKEHGYDVRVQHMSWRDNKKRTIELTDFIFKLSGPIHLIADSSLEDEMRSLAELHLANLASISLVESNNRIRKLTTEHLKPKNDGIQRIFIHKKEPSGFTNRVSNLALKANNLANYPNPPVQAAEIGLGQSPEHQTMKPYLDHLISLAEKDLQC